MKQLIHIIFIIFLVFLFISVSTKESFVENDDKNTIIDIFNELNMDTPSNKTIDFYVNYMTQNELSKENLKGIIIENNSIKQEIPKINKNIVNVNTIYNDVLFRNPSKEESEFYSNLLITDKDFTLDKLRSLLLESTEYKRMILTQDNAVYNDIEGNATDRQIEYTINKIHNDVTGRDVDDKETMLFLKKKYIKFNLDNDKLKNFINMYLQNKPYEDSVDNKVLKIDPEEINFIKNELIDEIKKSFNKERVNKDITDKLENISTKESDTYLDTDNIVNTINNESKKVFNKDTKDFCYTNYGPKQTFADEQNKRNMDELKNICVRNLKTKSVDQDLVLDPRFEWSVPQKHGPVCVNSKNNYNPMIEQTSLIGTLLSDVNNEKIIGRNNPIIT